MRYPTAGRRRPPARASRRATPTTRAAPYAARPEEALDELRSCAGHAVRPGGRGDLPRRGRRARAARRGVASDADRHAPGVAELVGVAGLAPDPRPHRVAAADAAEAVARPPAPAAVRARVGERLPAPVGRGPGARRRGRGPGSAARRSAAAREKPHPAGPAERPCARRGSCSRPARASATPREPRSTSPPAVVAEADRAARARAAPGGEAAAAVGGHGRDVDERGAGAAHAADDRARSAPAIGCAGRERQAAAQHRAAAERHAQARAAQPPACGARSARVVTRSARASRRRGRSPEPD